MNVEILHTSDAGRIDELKKKILIGVIRFFKCLF